ncbi:unnamed protein product, partial [Amoebophrya sp. A25]
RYGHQCAVELLRLIDRIFDPSALAADTVSVICCADINRSERPTPHRVALTSAISRFVY